MFQIFIELTYPVSSISSPKKALILLSITLTPKQKTPKTFIYQGFWALHEWWVICVKTLHKEYSNTRKRATVLK